MDDKVYRIYTLDIIPNTEEIIDYLQLLYHENEEEDEGFFIPYIVMSEEVELSWPNHEDVMKEISLRFPTMSFELQSQGDRLHDLWKKVFYNGGMRVYRGKVWYDEIKEL